MKINLNLFQFIFRMLKSLSTYGMMIIQSMHLQNIKEEFIKFLHKVTTDSPASYCRELKTRTGDGTIVKFCSSIGNLMTLW